MSKTRKRADGFLAALLILIIAAGCIFLVREIRSPGTTAQMLEQGSESLTDQFYSTSVKRLAKSLEEDPEDTNAQGALSGAYLAWAQSLVDRKEYERAESVLQEGLTLLPEDPVLVDLLEKTQAQSGS